MKTNSTLIRLAALSALFTLQACHSSNAPSSAYDPWQNYPLGTVHNCDQVAQPDMRTNTDQLPTPGFGCAHQSNITLMAANPEDLVTPRPMTPSDPRRGQRIYEAYGEGEDTTTAKRVEGTQALIE